MNYNTLFTKKKDDNNNRNRKKGQNNISALHIRKIHNGKNGKKNNNNKFIVLLVYTVDKLRHFSFVHSFILIIYIPYPTNVSMVSYRMMRAYEA